MKRYLVLFFYALQVFCSEYYFCQTDEDGGDPKCKKIHATVGLSYTRALPVGVGIGVISKDKKKNVMNNSFIVSFTRVTPGNTTYSAVAFSAKRDLYEIKKNILFGLGLTLSQSKLKTELEDLSNVNVPVVARQQHFSIDAYVAFLVRNRINFTAGIQYDLIDKKMGFILGTAVRI
jgi:hypothetical protein